MPALPTVAFAGIGLMGLPMLRRLIAAGYSLRVWNRSLDKCRALEEEGCPGGIGAGPGWLKARTS